MDIKEVQDAAFKILVEIDRICKKNDIIYFLDSGTLLGAVRHKDFIPWDDDIDIVFTRKNLAKFIKYAKKDLGEDFDLILPGHVNGEAWADFTPRIEYKKFWMKQPEGFEEFYAGRFNHTSADLFVLDSAYESKIVQTIHRFRLLVVYGLAMGHRPPMDYNKMSFGQRIGIRMLSLLGKRISVKTLVKEYSKLSIRKSCRNSPYLYYSNFPVKDMYHIMEKKWFAQSTEAEFRNRNFSIPIGYHEVLTELYGNYMELPPESQRVPLHNFE